MGLKEKVVYLVSTHHKNNCPGQIHFVETYDEATHLLKNYRNMTNGVTKHIKKKYKKMTNTNI